MQLYCGSWNVRLLTIRIFHCVVNLFIGLFLYSLGCLLVTRGSDAMSIHSHTNIHSKYSHDLWSTFDTIFNIFRVSLCHPRVFFYLFSQPNYSYSILHHYIVMTSITKSSSPFLFFFLFSTMFVTVFWVDSIMLQRLLLFRFDMHNFFTQFSIC